MNKKVYILKQQWLDITPGAIIVKHPTDNYYYEVSGQFSKNNFPCSFVENNLSWFFPKEDKIEVTDIWGGMKCPNNSFVNGFSTNIPVPQEKYEAVKNAIEFVLNDKRINSIVAYMKDLASMPMYTEKQLLDAEQNAFIAGAGEDMGAYVGGGDSYRLNKSKYRTFSDYKNSQSKP